MKLGRILAALVGITLSVVSAQDAGNSTEQIVAAEPPVCGPRIRKSWERLTPVEKDVYLRAIERAMDDGLYIKFVEIHTEQMTTSEAHRTCMFVYWHRALLLGFENLLRSYGGEFSCITLPYWDYVAHNERFMAGQCGSLEDCSPILRELGGSTRGRTRTLTVNGTPVDGRCVATPPVNHFCEDSRLRGPSCAQCVTRGDWTTATFPGTTTVSSLMRQLFSTPTIDGVASNLEQGIHNTIHNSLGGVMGVLEAPADPIFWSHHSSIDLLHSIFYHCAVGNTVPMPLESKITDPRQYVRCPRRTALPVNRAIDRNELFPQSNVMLRSGGVSEAADPVLDPQNPLEQFFAPLPTEYMSFSDIRDLGDLSYNYEMSGPLASMYTSCASMASILGEAATTSVSSTRGTRGSTTPQRARASSTGGLRRLEDQAASSLLEAVIVPAKEASEQSDGWYPAALRAALNATSSIAEKNPAVSPTALALREVEKMTCMFYNECRGAVIDFSSTFRSSFHTNSSTPCFTIVNNIESGQDKMLVTNWKDILLKYLTC